MQDSLTAHLTAIMSGTVTKTNIIGLRKAIMATEKAFTWGGSWARKPCATREEIGDVDRALRAHTPRVTGELHDGGLAVLRNRRYAKRWTDWQRAAIDAAEFFQLVRFDIVNGEHGFVCVPVYALWARVPAKGDALDGGSYRSFCFRNIPWQSGGNGPEIVGENRAR